MQKNNHIIVDANTQSIRCTHCSASVGWTLPMRLDLYIALLHEAIRVHGNCRPTEKEIYRCHYGELVFCVVRRGDTVYVDVLKNGETISSLDTWIAPWASNAPQHGNAYYWQWDGLNHSSSAIAPKTSCHADSDGDCEWVNCPQLRDGEPKKTGRHCPLDCWSIEDES